jgi:hypothetical protein
MYTNPLWELACQRWRPDSRPISSRCTSFPVGASLFAKAGSLAALFNGQQKFQNLPAIFSGCPSDVASLTFGLSLTHSAIGLRGPFSQA